ncbi:hypothetical protein GCM10011396_11520 [Undibacterium terreum]|uniref:Uncharacterized protein n=1 Tax=Undibacterium terreum TaxID=1224302 RepID=A0A916XEM1_9BURK|nr:hypothetical protein GCM10011396_11520 [Undibacterium terreum]
MLTEIGIVGLSILLMAWALQPQRRVAKLLFAALLIGAAGIFTAMMSMHMPAHFAYFGLELLALALIAFLLGVSWLILGFIRPLASKKIEHTGEGF